MPYEAPTIVRYGSVAGLTASAVKCTPGGDTGLASAGDITAIDFGDGYFATGANGTTAGDPYDPSADGPECYNTDKTRHG